MSCKSSCCGPRRPTVCVFTGNSRTGSACLKELFRRYSWYMNIRGVFRSEEKAKRMRDEYPALEFVVGVDARKPETLSQAFRGVKSAFIVQPNDENQSNDSADLSVRIINAAVEYGVSYIVYLSSFAASRPDELPLIADKFTPAEKLLIKLNHENDLRFTVLRSGLFMQNFEQVFESVKNASSFTYPNVRAAYVDLRDVGKCAALCLATKTYEHNKKFYQINGPDVLSAQDVANSFSKVLDKEVKWKELPSGDFQNSLSPKLIELYEYLQGLKSEDEFLVRGDMNSLIGPGGSFEHYVREHKLQLEKD